jgi:hypothetical protein
MDIEQFAESSWQFAVGKVQKQFANGICAKVAK